MDILQGFDFFRLRFDADGNPVNAQELQDFKQRAAGGATDAILIAHGFRNSEDEATTLCSEFLKTFRDHLNGDFKGISTRKYIVGGIYWPSKAFKEVEDLAGSTQGLDSDTAEKEAVRLQLEEMKADATEAQKVRLDKAIQLLDSVKDDPGAQDEFVKHVLSTLDDSELDATEGIDEIRAQKGSDLLNKLSLPIIVSTGRDENEGGVASAAPIGVPDEEGGTQGFGSFFTTAFGKIGQFLNLTTWYQMKNRGGVVGANGVAKLVRSLKQDLPSMRVHLVGHSLGARLMAACAKTLAMSPPVRPDSLSLLEAAFSHYGFSANNGKGQAGFFRSVVSPSVLVKGPLFATFSAQDTVVGKVYAIASRLAGDNTEAVGDKDDPFGGIGRNGAQKTDDLALFETLRVPGSAVYQFQAGKIHCLDGSGGLIKDHSDVKNPNVTFAFACAVSQT